MTDSTSRLTRRPAGIVPNLPRAVRRLAATVAPLRESPVGMIGAALVLFWVIVALIPGWLAPFDPLKSIAPMKTVWTPTPDGTGTFWLGTDMLGLDLLSRIVHGSRQVLIYGPLATFCAYIVGIPMGLVAAYRGGVTDDVLSFIANVILSFPVLVLYLVIIATIGASALNIVLAVTFASAPGIMRIVRGLVLDLRSREYVFAAQTHGDSEWRIMLVEILPNARGPLVVDSCLRLGYVIITIGVLGFLGLGLSPPEPDWGGMINENRNMVLTFPHMALFPCIALSSLVLGFNLLADGMREITLRD